MLSASWVSFHKSNSIPLQIFPWNQHVLQWGQGKVVRKGHMFDSTTGRDSRMKWLHFGQRSRSLWPNVCPILVNSSYREMHKGNLNDIWHKRPLGLVDLFRTYQRHDNCTSHALMCTLHPCNPMDRASSGL